MKKIDFEAHFYTTEYLKALSENSGYPRLVDEKDERSHRLFYYPEVGQPFAEPLLNALLNLDGERLEVMDACGVDVQVLSLSAPGLEQLDPEIGTALAVEANNSLSEAIKRNPDRFMGYAALAPKAPQEAARELERAVKELGFIGWNTHSNYGDSYLDHGRYEPLLEQAERLDVPIYIHPTVPAMSQARTYGIALAGAGFGFGMDAALCLMRLIFSGAFDKYSRLKVILGHLGEALPFLMKRMNWAYVRPLNPAFRPALSKKPSDYFKSNIFVTTSGNYYEPAFLCTREAVGIDRILLGMDYPYEDPKECMDFFNRLSIPEKEKEQVYSGNASLLGISV